MKIFSPLLFAFSSYTKGMHPIENITKEKTYYLVDIQLPLSFEARFNKRRKKFDNTLYLEIDGIPALVNTHQSMQDYLLVKTKIPAKLFTQSTLGKLKQGDRVSIGMPSLNKQKYLLENTPRGKAILTSQKIAPKHTHTQELCFETSTEHGEMLKNQKWLGLNGSGLFIQNYRLLRNKAQFWVHIGQQTRALSIFGSQDLKAGHEFNLSAAFNKKAPR